MATIGEQLLQPESGWKRYDDIDSNINYIGNWRTSTESGSLKWSGSNQISNIINNKIQFNFTGDKIRIISSTAPANSNNIEIKIDNNIINSINMKTTNINYQVLVYEKIGMCNKEHFLEITNLTNDYIVLDAIDIDKSGQLKIYNPNLCKFLIKQNNQYYTIKSEFYKNGNYESIPELEGKEILTKTDFETYGIDDLNSLTKTIDTQVIDGIDKGNLGNGKLFEISFDNDFMSISEVK
ncbi:cell adhesion protein [Clostridium botulinum]